MTGVFLISDFNCQLLSFNQSQYLRIFTELSTKQPTEGSSQLVPISSGKRSGETSASNGL